MENNVEEIDESREVAFLDLDFDSLEAVFLRMQPVDRFRVARTCSSFRDVCEAIWRRDSKNFNCIKGPEDGISFKDYTFYICTMAKYIEQLRLYSSDIVSFSTACRGLDMRNLVELRFVHDYQSPEIASATFLPQCTSLRKIDLCQPLLEAYKSDVLNLPNLDKMDIVRTCFGFDELMQEVISKKENQLIKLDLPVDYFPPCWLNTHTMQNCNKLEELVIETRFAKTTHLNLPHDFPFLPSVCSLKLIGTSYHPEQIKRLVSQLPNLRTLTLYYCDGMDLQFLNEMSCSRLDDPYNFSPLYCRFYINYRELLYSPFASERSYDNMNKYYSLKNLAEVHLDPLNLYRYA